MENHKIIRDESALRAFISWLPELKDNEKFFVCLQARKKYQPNLKSSDRTVLRRFLANKNDMFNKIRQLECPVGSFVMKDGTVVTDDGLAVYVTITPRDMKRATFMALKHLADMIEREHYNLYNEVLSCVHKAKAKSNLAHFDIDATFQDSDMDKITEIVGDAATVVITRGGWHLVVDTAKVGSGNWYKTIQTTFNCDQSGDIQMPAVGCCQGGFTPYFFDC